MSQPIIAGTSWPQDALEHVGACPACGNAHANYPAYEGVVDILGETPGTWSLHECAGCASLYLDPRPAGYGLAMAYRTYYTHEGKSGGESATGTSVVARLVNGYLAHRFGVRDEKALHAGRWLFAFAPVLRQQLDYFLRHLPRAPGALLDVGCGNGEFLRRAGRAGWLAEGLEPDDVAANVARRAGGRVSIGTLDTFESPRKFDAITMSHVIEHVPDPRETVKRAYELLARGGMLWMATPNVESAGRRRYGADWRGLEAPRHTVIFNARALARMVRDAGYEDIRFHRRGRGARYSLLQSELAMSRRGVRVRKMPVWWVDLLASISPFAGEELVLTARKPL